MDSMQPAMPDPNALDSEEQFTLDAALLQSVSDSIAALFPQCSNEGQARNCLCFFCEYNVPTSSSSAAAMQYRALPPPSRYVRSARRDSLPPKGPVVAGSKEIALGPING